MPTKYLLPLLFLTTSCLTNAAPSLFSYALQINQQPMSNENSVWQRLRDGFSLEHNQTKEVKYWEKRYSNPKYFAIIMQNTSPYLYFVVSELERRGMPTELALIPIVESTYNPNAISPAAISTGMWQFVASSGQRFGLTLDKDLDERKDIVKSTRAALTYLQYLHDLFGSWELAIAAYNWGEGNINAAVNRAGSKNFYDLDVRDVTRQYVPKVIALANIISNPSRFGIRLSDLPNKPYFAIIKPAAPLKVSDFMSQAQLTPELNRKLNPQYAALSYAVKPSQRLLLPVTNQPLYLAQTQNIPAGTSPSVAATDDAITTLVTAVDSSNPPRQSAPALKSDEVTDLLATAQGASKAAPNGIAKANFISYSVMPGDTLYSIAKKFAVPLENIKSDNQMVDNTIKLNQKLLIRQANPS
jgi:membrane-bound lytic murein transglycosylase D